METIRYGIIGAGAHAFWGHALPVQHIRGLELAAIYDIDLKNLEHFKKLRPQLTACDSEEQLFGLVDAVIICSPDEYHARTCLRAVQAGKHVLVEKPVAVSRADLALMRRAFTIAARKGLAVTTCHPGRFERPFVYLKNNLPLLAQQLGSVIFYQYDFSYQRPSQIWQLNRSLLLDHCTHEIDCINFLFGRRRGRAETLVNTYDRYEVTGSRADINFRLHGTRLLGPNMFWSQVMLRFERGLTIIEIFEGQAKPYKGFATIVDHEQRSRKTVAINNNFPQFFAPLHKNFLGVIAGIAQPYISAEEILFNNEFALALAKKGRHSW